MHIELYGNCLLMTEEFVSVDTMEGAVPGEGAGTASSAVEEMLEYVATSSVMHESLRTTFFGTRLADYGVALLVSCAILLLRIVLTIAVMKVSYFSRRCI